MSPSTLFLEFLPIRSPFILLFLPPLDHNCLSSLVGHNCPSYFVGHNCPLLFREVQRPTKGRSTGPNRDCRSQKMGRTGLGPTSVRSASGLRSWTEGRNPPYPRFDRILGSLDSAFRGSLLLLSVTLPVRTGHKNNARHLQGERKREMTDYR